MSITRPRGCNKRWLPRRISRSQKVKRVVIDGEAYHVPAKVADERDELIQSLDTHRRLLGQAQIRHTEFRHQLQALLDRDDMTRNPEARDTLTEGTNQ